MSDGRWLSRAEDSQRRALRQALDEAAPFAPSDVRRHRVWVELARARTHHRLTRRAFVAGAALASALTAGIFIAGSHFSQRPPPEGRGEHTLAGATPAAPAPARGPVAPLSPPPAVPAQDPIELRAPGASITTGPDERRVVRLIAGARAEVQPESALAVDAIARLEVLRGLVRFDVPPQAAGRPFMVMVASYYVMVAGARFSARVDAGRVRITVQSGAVEVWGPGRLARLAAGESWSRVARASGARTLATRAAAERPGAPTAERSPLDDPAAASDAADLALAREAGAADPAQAIAIYERIVARGGPAAENALYQIGSVYHDRLHDPARAVAAWERYRTRYPHGQLRVEADLSILDSVTELGQRDRAVDEGLAFLRRHPGSERRGEVARVTADLARARGQCRLAATLYAQVADARVSSDDADDAAFGRASCLQTLGDESAQAALADYLAAYPRGRHGAEARKLAAAQP